MDINGRIIISTFTLNCGYSWGVTNQNSDTFFTLRFYYLNMKSIHTLVKYRNNTLFSQSYRGWPGTVPCTTGWDTLDYKTHEPYWHLCYWYVSYNNSDLLHIYFPSALRSQNKEQKRAKALMSLKILKSVTWWFSGTLWGSHLVVFVTNCGTIAHVITAPRQLPWTYAPI